MPPVLLVFDALVETVNFEFGVDHYHFCEFNGDTPPYMLCIIVVTSCLGRFAFMHLAQDASISVVSKRLLCCLFVCANNDPYTKDECFGHAPARQPSSLTRFHWALNSLDHPAAVNLNPQTERPSLHQHRGTRLLRGITCVIQNNRFDDLLPIRAPPMSIRRIRPHGGLMKVPTCSKNLVEVVACKPNMLIIAAGLQL